MNEMNGTVHSMKISEDREAQYKKTIDQLLSAAIHFRRCLRLTGCLECELGNRIILAAEKI